MTRAKIKKLTLAMFKAKFEEFVLEKKNSKKELTVQEMIFIQDYMWYNNNLSK